MSSYFELTNETIEYNGRTLYRIRATKALPWHSLEVGDLGGWIEKQTNLRGEAWVHENAKVYDNAIVDNHATIGDNAEVFGDAQVHNAEIHGQAKVFGKARISDEAMIRDFAIVRDNAQVDQGAFVHGKAIIAGNAHVTGWAEAFGSVRLFGNAIVSGSATLYGQLDIGGDATIDNTHQFLSVSNVGWQGDRLVGYQTTTGTVLRLGTWEGTPENLTAHFDELLTQWQKEKLAPQLIHRYRKEFQLLTQLVTTRFQTQPMLRIGLTGGIGSGKSTVAALLAEAGIPIIDADKIAREIVEPGQPALAELAEAFGTDILTEDGTLHRQALAAKAFANSDATATLNKITHPRIEQRTQQLFAEAETAGHRLAVWDMPLLVDKGYHTHMDAVIVVDVDAETRIQRLVNHRGLDEADARRRITAQISDEERRKAATYIIDNNGTAADLAPQVEKIMNQLLSVE